MQLIRPMTIDRTNLTSNVPIDDGTHYSATATYSLGDIVIDTSGADATFHKFESLADSNRGNLLTDAAYWLDLGPVNRLRMFDQKVGTVTTNATIDVRVVSEGVSNGLALFNLDAQSVQVIVTNDAGSQYNETYSLRSTFGIVDWYSWFTQEAEYTSDLILTDLPPFNATTVRVIITSGSGDVGCGTMVLGKLRNLGTGPFYGARGGITDYSKKTTDEFGDTSLVERPFAKRITLRSMVANGDTDGVFRVIAQYRATPVVWIGKETFKFTCVYGWARDWGLEITYPTNSILALEIEGLT